MVRGRPVNSEGRHNRSASDVPRGRAADGVDEHETVETERPTIETQRRVPPRRPVIPPDDQRTAIIPSVRDDRPLRDPIDAVKAALDGTPPPPLQPPPGPPRRPPGGGVGGGGPPGRPPRRLPATEQINWKWVRRGLYATVAALILLPIVTFG